MCWRSVARQSAPSRVIAYLPPVRCPALLAVPLCSAPILQGVAISEVPLVVPDAYWGYTTTEPRRHAFAFWLALVSYRQPKNGAYSFHGLPLARITAAQSRAIDQAKDPGVLVDDA